MYNNYYDVIIVGAGPAGLECANQLKGTDLSVLIIERNSKIGPKICAGGITPLDDEFFDLPYKEMRSFREQYVYVYNKEYMIDLFKPIRTVDREVLGQYQLNKLLDYKNITILTDTTVKEVRDRSIITMAGTYYFDILVGADGANSIVRRSLGLDFKHCVGIYYKINKIEDKMKWVFKPKELGMAYIWVFPHQDHTNIGIYFDPKLIHSFDAKRELEVYLKENNYSFDPQKFKASVINTLYRGYKFDNKYLIGEAGGFASRISGEGISFALLSGNIIGKAIAENDIEKYKGKMNELLAIKRRQENFENAFYRFKTHPYFVYVVFNFIVALWNFKGIQKWFWGI